jgi:hypothetical protein
MIKFLFACLLLLHGLIHLMGFAKAFRYAEISQLTQPITKPAGAMWGLSALLFTIAAVLFFMKKDSWWMWALPIVILSQILIFSSWQDARFGTIANLIAVLGIVIGYGHWDFKKLTDSELQKFHSQPVKPASVVTEENIASLPPIVQTWLRRSGVVGKPAVFTVHLRQTGAMRTAPEGKWMPVSAEQYFTVQPPGFLWLADVKMMPFVHLAGRDKYEDGKGHMLIKALSLIPVADSKGPEIDQGTMLRYLGETIWFPPAALSEYLSWENLDATSARATMTWGGITASGIFYFTENGDMTAFEADRYYDRQGTSTLERWRIEAKDWKEFIGVRMPVQFDVTWKLKEGDFTWFRLEVTDVVYDGKAG